MSEQFRERINREQQEREFRRWLKGFNRMVRTSNFQLNVLHQPIHTPEW